MAINNTIPAPGNCNKWKWHGTFRLRCLISGQPGIHVVGEAANGLEAVWRKALPYSIRRAV